MAKRRSRKRVFIHIGTHKTGTTSAQAWAVRNFDTLLENDWLYAETGRQKHDAHSNIPWLLEDNDPNASLLEGMTRDRLLKDLRAEIDASPAHNVLLSAEDMCTLRAENIKPLGEALEGYEVNVIGLFRDQPSFLVSQYVEWLKHLLTNDNFLAFIAHLKDSWILDYGQIEEQWTKVFGRDCFHVLRYSPGDNSAARLFQHLGIDYSGPNGAANENTSPSAEVVSAWKYLLNRTEFELGLPLSVFLLDTNREARVPVREEMFGTIEEIRSLVEGEASTWTRFTGFSVTDYFLLKEYFEEQNRRFLGEHGLDLWDDPWSLDELDTGLVQVRDKPVIDKIKDISDRALAELATQFAPS